MLNDQVEKKKRFSNGSRNLNAQAKLMITQPSERSGSLYEEGGGFLQSSILSPLSAMRYNKMKLPSLSSPLNDTSESYYNSTVLPNSHQTSMNQAFEMQPL